MKQVLAVSSLLIVAVFAGSACILTDAISPPGTLVEPTQVILPSLRLADIYYLPDEEIQVYFTAPLSYAEDALVAVIRADAPHGSGAAMVGAMLSYQFLEGRTSGVLGFVAPHSLGSYEVRMYGSGADSPEVASTGFKVTDLGAELYIPEATLKLDKKFYTPGEEVRVFFTALEEFEGEPWIGLVPSSITHGSEEKNRAKAIATQTLNGRTSGILIFIAPTYLDEYDLRMNVDGGEVSSVSFRVVEY